jgi:hypothetical protein
MQRINELLNQVDFSFHQECMGGGEEVFKDFSFSALFIMKKHE